MYAQHPENVRYEGIKWRLRVWQILMAEIISILTDSGSKDTKAFKEFGKILSKVFKNKIGESCFCFNV